MAQVLDFQAARQARQAQVLGSIKVKPVSRKVLRQSEKRTAVRMAAKERL